MEFKRIFTKDSDCKLWSVCYPEDNKDEKPRDIFKMLLDRWSNTEYLDKFFNEHEQILNSYWGLTIDDAFNRVELESLKLQIKLKKVVKKEPGYEHLEVNDLFEKLHVSSQSTIMSNESHRKTKPPTLEPMLRIYGIELEDGTIIITGGGIKLYRSMQESGLEAENLKLKRVQRYLKEEGITTNDGLK